MIGIGKEKKSELKKKTHNFLHRDVWCLLGLPVDNLTMESVKKLIRNKTKEGYPKILSTINVNWVAQSFTDPQFRSAIISSDIVTIDGRPLLWLSKSLKYPISEVVAGSTLIQNLLEDKPAVPLTIFLFGGEEGVAEKAMEEINEKKGGLRAVGALNPGYGTVEEMSSDEIISQINNAQPDILLVALGARKGVQWIETNKDKLNVHIISHLGATINFLAGNIKRAPRVFQEFGFEWLWRVLQEPKLFWRYLQDGLKLGRILAQRVLSYLKYRKLISQIPDEIESAEIAVDHDNMTDIELPRFVCLERSPQLRELIINQLERYGSVRLDFQRTIFLDGAFVAFFILLKNMSVKKNWEVYVVNVAESLQMCANVFLPRDLSLGD